MSIKTKEASVKPCRWVGSSLKDLQDFPDQVKKDIGTALRFAQAGQKAGSAKPYKGVGSGVLEIVDDHDGDTYRCVYLLRLKGSCMFCTLSRRNRRRASRRRPRTSK